jgi:unsaturated chondroitin disaccharide hydrolase
VSTKTIRSAQHLEHLLFKIISNLLLIFASVSLCFCTSDDVAPDGNACIDTLTFSPDRALNFAQSQLKLAFENIPFNNLYPRSTNKDGSLSLTPASDWTSGFFAGNLWLMYQYTEEEYWKKAAMKWTEPLESNKFNTSTHDLGFMMYCSFGNGYRLTNDAQYKDILLTSAKSLASRFNAKIGCIQSWNHPEYEFPVIIDNMMNLELLFWATATNGDSSFYKIAETHALTTMANHYRADYSVYQVVDFSKDTGQAIWKGNRQGYDNTSAWARGQAWGLYGYTMCYRETKNPEFLAMAENIASYILHQTDKLCGNIPFWDYNAPNIPNEPKDASAAAITCSALIELSEYSSANKAHYLAAVENILAYLSSEEYQATLGTNNNFILKHSVGSFPANKEIDVPLIYADYYYIESLLKYMYK